MGDRETHFNSSSYKIESWQDACRTHDLRNIQDFLTRSLVNDGSHFSADVGRDRNFDEPVFQDDECVPLKNRPVGSFAVADVRIDSVRIQSGRHGPARRQLVREDIVLVLKRDCFVRRFGCQARCCEDIRQQADSQSKPCHVSIR